MRFKMEMIFNSNLWIIKSLLLSSTKIHTAVCVIYTKIEIDSIWKEAKYWIIQSKLVTIISPCAVIILWFKHIYFTSIEKQIFTTYTNLSRFCILGTTPALMPDVWANENPKVDTHSQELNSRSYDCEADGLPHDHRHHTIFTL